MANEFIARNGLISLNSAYISGSTSINSGNLTVGTAYGFGASYGPENEGIFQVSASSPFYKTQIWLRPSGNPGGYNSNYWSLIEQSSGTDLGLIIQPGNYLDLIFRRVAASSNMRFMQSGSSTDIMRLTTGNKVLINTNTDTGLYYLDVNGAARIQGKLTISTGGAEVTGSLGVSAGISAGVTGSLLGSASFSTTASYSISSSYSITSSFAITASNADFLDGRDSLTFATTGSNTFAGNQIVTGWVSASAGFTGSFSGSHYGFFTGSFSGSLFGSASYSITASNAISSSNTITSSFAITASNADFLDGFHALSFATTGSNSFSGSQSITGSLTVTGNVIAQQYILSSSVMYVTESYASGSHIFGNSLDDTHQFTGSVTITGSLATAGNLGISGSLLLNTFNQTAVQIVGNINSYSEFSIRNTNTGISASTDIAAYADTGTALNNYIDMGISNSGLTGSYYYGGTNLGGALDSYLYSVGGNLRIGNANSATTSQSLFIFSNPLGNPDLTITGSRIGIQKTGSLNASLDVAGSVVVSGSITVTGSVINQLTASYAVSAAWAPGGGSGTPGGATTQVQYNNAGAFGGSANFIFNNTTNKLIITGSLGLRSSAIGSTVLEITSSNGTGIFSVIDNTGSTAPIFTISSGSSTYLSIDSQGSTTASIVTNALYYGILAATISSDQNDYSPAGWNSANPAKKTVISISGSTSVKITGLTGGIDGRVAVIQNDSPNFVVILEDQSASSQAANRFDFHNSVFLLPSDAINLMYDGHSSRWEPVGSSTAIEYGAYFDTFEDFLGDIGRWGATATGTQASAQVGTYLQNTTERPLGVWQADTGNTAVGKTQIGSTQVNSIYPGYGQAIFLSRVALEQLSTAAQRFNVNVGWHNSLATASVSNGIYWRYTDAFSTAWQGVAQSASFTVSSSVNGPAADTNYIWLGAYTNSTWTAATYFYSTDSTTWTIAGVVTGSNMPSNLSTASFGAAISKQIGTTQCNLSVDLLAHRYDITRG